MSFLKSALSRRHSTDARMGLDGRADRDDGHRAAEAPVDTDLVKTPRSFYVLQRLSPTTQQNGSSTCPQACAVNGLPRRRPPGACAGRSGRPELMAVFQPPSAAHPAALPPTRTPRPCRPTSARRSFRPTPIPPIRLRPPRRRGRPQSNHTPRNQRSDPGAGGNAHHKHQAAQALPVAGDGRALEYGIGVGRQGFAWKGEAEIGRKAYWPGWTPPPEMLARSPELPPHLDGSLEQSAGRTRALPLPGQQGHAVSHPRHQRAEFDGPRRVVGLIRMPTPT